MTGDQSRLLTVGDPFAGTLRKTIRVRAFTSAGTTRVHSALAYLRSHLGAGGADSKAPLSVCISGFRPFIMNLQRSVALPQIVISFG
jgi:hypothetical protein